MSFKISKTNFLTIFEIQKIVTAFKILKFKKCNGFQNFEFQKIQRLLKFKKYNGFQNFEIQKIIKRLFELFIVSRVLRMIQDSSL